MAAPFLTMTSSMNCPHGGSVVTSTSNTRVKADGQFVLRSTDQLTIGGCPFMRGVQPNPCVRVRWDVHCEQHESERAKSLTRDSVGLCLDASGATQGTVVIGGTQQRGSGS